LTQTKTAYFDDTYFDPDFFECFNEFTQPLPATELSSLALSRIATIWLKGGTLGTEYTVTNKIVTTAGRTDERSFTITIEDR
jgi:hypothetical protein